MPDQAECTEEHYLKGVLFPCDIKGWVGIQRCDVCQKFDSDEDAANTLAKVLPEGYMVAFAQVLEDPTEAGAWGWVVTRNGSFIPLHEMGDLLEEVEVEI